MIQKEQNGLVYFQFDAFSQKKNIKHFISTRINNKDTSFNLSLYNRSNTNEIIENRQDLAKFVDIPFTNFIFQQQVHSKNISILTKADAGKGIQAYYDGISDNDAMITNKPGVCLTVMAGDCVPILFYDPIKKIIAAAHAGWRGTYKRVTQLTIEMMTNQFGCKASDILAGIGPSISQKNYEVDDHVYIEFEKRFDNLSQIFTNTDENGKYYLDLWEANKQQLISAGLSKENIELSNICTFDQNNLFFSARRGDKGRFVAGIMLCDD
ncbi:MAG: peptidoglycan editing factor PgeF [Bacteroidetes bacterium]|nr:MAG: peptidoglycan editing factor PgeF [Bacteroidota bacterium]